MTKRKEIRLPNRRHPRFVVRSVTGFPIPKYSASQVSGNRKPSTIWYVMDRWFCFAVVAEFRKESVARREQRRLLEEYE